MDIYIRRGEEQFGPLTPEQLQESYLQQEKQAKDLLCETQEESQLLRDVTQTDVNI